MKTPIFDFVSQYAASDTSRFHMPGHKGRAFLGCESMDITEVEGADVLYDADGVIAESEQNATALFDTAHSYYSAEGSSLCIKAMLGLVAQTREDGKRVKILAARNVHKAFIYACALLDLDVAWLYPHTYGHLCTCEVRAEDVERELQRQLPAAVYLTSPDYLGQIADVEGIASVCKAYGVPLLVDNAHGAYLQFLQPSRHPMALGATMCCDSAHKTLPVLTGGAYLHFSKDADPAYLQNARGMLAMFASTSPSYLILQSLDLCNRYLADGYRERLAACIDRLQAFKQWLASRGFFVEASEPLKLVLNTRRSGYDGVALAAHLRTMQIEVEFADRDVIVLMVTPETRELDYERLTDAFSAIDPKPALPLRESVGLKQSLSCACTVRRAMLAPHEIIPTRESLGRVCAMPTVSCPPAVPVVVSGEIITEEAIRLLLFYGVDRIDVLKD